MSIQLAYETENDTYPECYFRIEGYHCVKGSHYQLLVNGYKSRAAANNGKRPVTDRGLSYYVHGEDYNTYFSEQVLKQAGNSPERQGYLWLAQHAPAKGSEIDLRGGIEV